MKRKLCLALILGILMITLCSCSMYGLDEQAESTTQQAPQIVIVQDTTVPVSEQQNDNLQTQVQTNVTTLPAQTQSQQTANSSDNTAESTTVAVKTYYTDNPDNKYIVTVSDKFSVDRSRLVAFVRVNSRYPGATVLQFKGNFGPDGKLITTTDELEYVYDVLDSGEIKKSNKDGSDTYGYNAITGRTAYALVEKYIMPDIEKFKVENRLEG